MSEQSKNFNVSVSITDVLDRLDKIASNQERMQMLVTGIDGQNGLSGRIKDIETEIEKIKDRVQKIQKTLYMATGGLIVFQVLIGLFKDKFF